MQPSAHPLPPCSLRGRFCNPGTNIQEDSFQCHRRARHVHCVAAKVALLSSRDNSPNLVPVIIVGGAQGSASSEFLDNLAWFREHGGIVYHHNLTFGSDLQVCVGTLSARLRYVLIAHTLSHSHRLQIGFIALHAAVILQLTCTGCHAHTSCMAEACASCKLAMLAKTTSMLHWQAPKRMFMMSDKCHICSAQEHIMILFCAVCSSV